MNHACIIGRLTKDVELRHTANGTAVANLRLARNEKYGEQERTLFVDVTVWGKLADCCAAHKRKGDQVAVSGRLHFSEFTDNEGNKRSKLEIVAHAIEFLARKQNGNGASHPDAPAQQHTASDEVSEEIPF